MELSTVETQPECGPMPVSACHRTPPFPSSLYHVWVKSSTKAYTNESRNHRAKRPKGYSFRQKPRADTSAGDRFTFAWNALAPKKPDSQKNVSTAKYPPGTTWNHISVRRPDGGSTTPAFSYWMLIRGQITVWPRMTHKVESTRKPSRASREMSESCVWRVLWKLAQFRDKDHASRKVRTARRADGPREAARPPSTAATLREPTAAPANASATAPRHRARAAVWARVHSIAGAGWATLWQLTWTPWRPSWPASGPTSAATSSSEQSAGRHTPISAPIFMEPRETPPSTRQYCMSCPYKHRW
mmetsp:Transcript_29624/g.89706  ORF Transcript_29624/g.89706 Transcript_29624/m.89706 type:complete len:301 (+) Transcript_29624:523-1425(+)